MQLTKQGIALIHQYEQFRNIAYIPVKGDRATIGWGNTFYADKTPVKLGDTITRTEANELFEFWINHFSEGVRDLLEVKLSEASFSSLVSFSYNVGLQAFSTSTLLKTINKERPIEEIGYQFSRWNKSGGKVYKGLTRRRNSEFYMYKNG